MHYVLELSMFSILPWRATLTVLVLVLFSLLVCMIEWHVSGNAINSLAFIGRVADELSSSSTFLLTVGSGSETVQGWRKILP